MPRYRPGYSRSTVSSRTGAVSETSIVFSSSGGHSHDGLNSSLIDTTKYSVWDFPVNTVYSTTPRASRQNAHIDQFRNFITSHVADNVLGPAGVTLRDNIINANNIIAGSITTDLLATNAITSLNYAYTSGDYSDSGTSLDLSTGLIRSENFAITADGDGKFKGTLEAAGGSLASFKITPSALLTDGFSSGTTNTVGVAGVSSSTFTSTGAIKIFNYGDVVIQSKPTSGPHASQFHQTEITGEYINIQEYGTNDFATANSQLKFTFIGSLGNSSSGILGNDEHKAIVRSNQHYALVLANDNGSLAAARQINDDETGPYSRADLQAFSDTPQLDINRRDDYTNSNSAFRSVFAAADSANAYIQLQNGTLNSPQTRVSISTNNGGSIVAGGTIQAEHFYSTDDAQIGDSTSSFYIDSDSDERVQIVSNTSTGRPFISFYNRNAGATLVRKGYIGYADSTSSGGAGMNIAADYGDLRLYAADRIELLNNAYFGGTVSFGSTLGGHTVTDTLAITGGGDVNLTNNNAYLRLGSTSGDHIAMDNNEIMAKSGSTGTRDLLLQHEGGNVRINNQIVRHYGNVKGGYTTPTTDANGKVTVSHGLGFQPDWVMITNASRVSSDGDPQTQCWVTNRTTTSFDVYWYENDLMTDTIANATVYFHWLAGD